MIVANATLEARASLGVGGFAYSALELDGSFSAPWFSVLSHRADASAPSFSLPVPTAALSDGILPALRDVAKHVTFAVEGLPSRGEARHFFSGGAASLRDVAKHVTFAVEGLLSLGEARRCLSGGLVLPVAKHVTASVEGLPSSFLSVSAQLQWSACSISLSVPMQLQWGACTISVSAPWFHTHARSSYTIIYQSPCRREARHCFGGACTLPKFGRTLRL